MAERGAEEQNHALYIVSKCSGTRELSDLLHRGLERADGVLGFSERNHAQASRGDGVASIGNVEEDRLVALLLKGARKDNGWVEMAGSVESDEADARQSPIPRGMVPSN
ncbi:MAG TPA: hypothetical protein VK638_34470 [Edaphobacter sp.]|nr:hypothetical protein [Edaphobacter sp.]